MQQIMGRLWLGFVSVQQIVGGMYVICAYRLAENSGQDLACKMWLIISSQLQVEGIM
jgi:hypothetical protein